MVNLIVTLPGVTDWVGGSGLSELLDFRIGQFSVEVKVRLSATAIDHKGFCSLLRNLLINKGLTSIHRGNLSRIEVRTHDA